MSNLREAAQRAIEVMANARDFIGEEHYKAPTKEWNSEQQADELQEALLVLRAALAEPQRKPLTQEEIDALFNRLCHERSTWPDRRYRDFARWVERAHGIGDSNG